jgi:arylsulfatase A-like enzyme
VDVHRWTNRSPRYETESFPATTGATAISWLEENWKAPPFFLWVDFFDPHEPWDPPEYLVKRYDPHYDGPPMWHPNYGPSQAYTAAELHNLWAHYAAEAELVDRWIGRLLQKLDDLQLWDDTIVAITSDHGMSLGEHGRTGKSNINDADRRYWPLYPELGHVPFLIAGGDVPRGQCIDVIGQPPDILPTLAELASAHLDPPKPFDGESLAPAISGAGPGHRDVAVSGGHIVTGGPGLPVGATTPFLVTQRWGYAPVGASGRHELFDLQSDPLAETDVSFDFPQEVADLHEAYLSHLSAHSASEETLKLWRTPGVGTNGGEWAVDYPASQTY